MTSNSPRKALANPSPTSSGSIVARNPTSPKFTANTGTLVPHRALAPRLAQPHERLAVALRPGQARGGEAQHRRPALVARGPGDGDQRLTPVLRRSHHAAAADLAAPDLELRLDHRQRVEA